MGNQQKRQKKAKKLTASPTRKRAGKSIYILETVFSFAGYDDKQLLKFQTWNKIAYKRIVPVLYA